jgi:integrase
MFIHPEIVAIALDRVEGLALRRTCATPLRDLEVHPWVAQRILRHAKVTITLDVYTEVSDDATREALRRLGETLGQ